MYTLPANIPLLNIHTEICTHTLIRYRHPHPCPIHTQTHTRIHTHTPHTHTPTYAYTHPLNQHFSVDHNISELSTTHHTPHTPSIPTLPSVAPQSAVPAYPALSCSQGPGSAHSLWAFRACKRPARRPARNAASVMTRPAGPPSHPRRPCPLNGSLLGVREQVNQREITPRIRSL